MNQVIVRKKVLAMVVSGLTLYLAGCEQLVVHKEKLDFSALPQWNLGEIQQTFKVSSVADSGSGTLREAIQLANASPGTDKVVFESDDGLYNQPQTIYLDSSLPTITDNLVIDGYIEKMLWKGSGVIIDGQSKYQIMHSAPSTKVKVEFLSFENGRAEMGGAMRSEGELVISGSLFSHNHASRNGGAIMASGVQTLIYNSTFYDNTSDGNGGGLFHGGQFARLTNNTFSENTAEAGGGLFNEGSIQIRNSILFHSRSKNDCESTSRPLSGSVRNIISLHENCGTPFSTEDPGIGKLGYYNGPTKTMPISTKGIGYNWGSNSAATNENEEPLKWDQRGNGDPRYALGITDIGAFEIQPRALFQIDTPSELEIRRCTRITEDCSITGAISLVNASARYSSIFFSADLCGKTFPFSLPAHIKQLSSTITLDASNCAKPIKLRANKRLKNEISKYIKLINVEII